VLVEVARKAYLASIVPVIVNAILNDHQIVVDIVAFVNKGDFPRSRLGEKQRGKILAGWVSRRMRTIAQFAIKDMDRDAALNPPGTSSGEQSSGGQGGGSGTVTDASGEQQHRASLGSFRSSSGGAAPGQAVTAAPTMTTTTSSLRNFERAPQIPEQRELEQQHPQYQQQQPHDPASAHALGTATPGPVEMPADENEITAVDNDQTPTKNRHQQQQQGGGTEAAESALPRDFQLPDFDRFGREDGGGGSDAKPGSSSAGQGPPQIRLPGVDGRESLGDWDLRPGSGSGSGSGNGGAGKDGDDDDWARDAYMSMNLAGTLAGK
jgi:hypothetical protein